jgi:hypothetical protein
VACAAFLALAISAAFCMAYALTSASAWKVPISYHGDALFLTAYLKAARDGRVVPGASIEVPELNAPYGANWNDHPRTLRPVFLAAGVVARWTGLFAAMNALLLLAHVLSGVVFYAVARHCGARPEWASVGGLAYGLSHFLFWRSLDHVDLALAWHLPVCVLVIAWAFSRRGLPLRSGRFTVAGLTAIVTAFHNPYYACLFALFLLLAVAAQLVRARRRRLAWAPLLVVGLLVATFLADHAGSLAYQWHHGSNPAASRPYGNLERYAMKPIELVLAPPGFGLAQWGRLAGVYWTNRLYRGEGGSPYLGLLGAVALALLAWRSFAALSRRPAQPPPPAALGVAAVIGFSMLGGVNQLLGLFGFLWLRGTNRCRGARVPTGLPPPARASRPTACSGRCCRPAFPPARWCSCSP